jgi:hypothetical protein
MPAIKPIDQASDKWVRRASVAGADYQQGVSSPKRSWSEAAKSAEGNYKTGVTAAANAGRYGKGVEKAGDSKWKDMALKKGPGRFAEGVAVGKDDWAKGFSPYHAAIGALRLPERGPRRSMQNYERSKLVGVTLGALKEKTG